MARALLVTVVAALTCAILSVWLVQIGWALMGDAVSHAVLPGVAISYILGWPFAVGAFIFGAGAVALIGGVRATTRIKSDAAIGVVFTALFALGLVIISKTPSQTDLGHILFGNVLGVSDADIWQVLGSGAIAVSLLLLKRRDLTLYAFDRAHADAIGINTRWLSMLLLGLLALTVVVALQAVGILLVVAMLITPGVTAYLLTKRFDRMLWLSMAITVVCAVAGLYLSYYLDASAGGAVVLTQSAAFLLAYLFGPRGGVVVNWIRSRREVVAA
ncbi:metal ABC transporter permease [Ruicaihuangia caeni]|uniref:Metal ABC transporter permease n=1 Tax=Ruicaihuangia caeni TaxID=3042517 RepID=A0AAW6T5D9_9MICO|nr:metal ABC transporter permease [Klugiella sp. YN-L-19]MDI2097373.1 metal ABC transporter permease [Klugiella sp. YN-L-19]